MPGGLRGADVTIIETESKFNVTRLNHPETNPRPPPPPLSVEKWPSGKPVLVPKSVGTAELAGPRRGTGPSSEPEALSFPKAVRVQTGGGELPVCGYTESRRIHCDEGKMTKRPLQRNGRRQLPPQPPFQDTSLKR